MLLSLLQLQLQFLFPKPFTATETNVVAPIPVAFVARQFGRKITQPCTKISKKSYFFLPKKANYFIFLLSNFSNLKKWVEYSAR